MTTSNKRGGFLKSLEVNRQNSNTSETILKDKFLSKTDNFVCEVSRFIISNSPQINLIDEDMFQVLTRGDQNFTTATVVNLPYALAVFHPTNYRTWLELARQMEEFFSALNVHFDDDRIQFKLLPNGMFQLVMDDWFATRFYLKVGQETQKYTGFKEFLFLTFDGDDYYNPINGIQYLFDVADQNAYDALPAGFGVAFEGETMEDNERGEIFQSGRPLSTFDHLLSLDVVSYFPIANTISVLDGTEEHEFILARFPLNDYSSVHTKMDTIDDEVARQRTMIETVNIGLEDLCRKNPSTITTYLLPGDIQHCLFRLETRYIQSGVIKRVPTDMEEGFWSIKLVFSKKET